MELDKIRVAVRPRTTAEAIDLGFVMARHWWRPLYFSWLMVALPLFIIFNLVGIQAPWLIIPLFWWCKPLYEQAPLYLLSRALFAEKTPMNSLAKDIWKIAAKQMIANLTWRRLSFRRSFNAPVAQLEDLKGKPRRERLRVLHGAQSSGIWLTIICAHFEIVIYASFLALITMLIPTELDISPFELLTNEGWVIRLLQDTLYFLAISIIAPFYVAAGFSLYLNRRIELEGWDIELNFRKLTDRVRQQSGKQTHKPASKNMVASLLLCFALFAIDTTGVDANPATTEQTSTQLIMPKPLTPDEAKAQINKILDDKIFGYKETEKVWRPIKDEEPKPASDLDLRWLKNLTKILAEIGEVVAWIALGLLLLWVLYRYPEWRHWVAFGKDGLQRRRTAPAMMFGLDVRPESLPDNVADEAWRLCQQNQIRAALSLLYRASLAHLINHHNAEFHKSATEGECLTVVKKLSLDDINLFFRQLTGVWQRMAYGHLTPSQDDMRSLCRDWDKHFGGGHEVKQ